MTNTTQALKDRWGVELNNQFKPSRLIYALYIFIYLPWFFAVEKLVPADRPDLHILNTAFDEALPFIEIFIIPYYMWFLYIITSCAFMLFFGSEREFSNMALSLIIGMSTCMLICMAYPNGVALRPEQVSSNIFGRLCSALYAVDTPTNVFPSIHVYNSIMIHVSLASSKVLKNAKAVRIASLVLCILICLSTMFLKQHSIIDVCGAIVLSVIMYIILNKFRKA